MDKNEAKNEKTAKKIIANFENTPGSILVGTEMALFYLTKEIESVAVVSFDSLFNIPHYNVYEKIIDLIVILNSFTKEVFSSDAPTRRKHTQTYPKQKLNTVL
ncbi:MAG: hypothetical protein R3B55_02415 [Candidatus Paceibacterota bacterium]